MSIRVLIVDRHPIIRQGVRALLEREGLEVVGEAGEIEWALHLVAETQPDVVVLEGYGPASGGFEAARLMTEACPRIRAVLLTHTAPAEKLHAGIRGYVLTSEHSADLARAIREVARGSIRFSAVDSLPLRAERDPLTPREHQVLRLIAEGRTTKEIGRILQRSTKTADAHRTRLMGKLNIHEVAGLVRYAIRRGLIQA